VRTSSRATLRLAALVVLALAGLAAWAQAGDEEGKDLDGDGVIDSDSTAVVLSDFELERLAAAAADSLASAAAGADAPFFMSLRSEPKAGIQAGVLKVRTYAGIGNNFTFRQNSTLRDNLDYSYESYRKQDKTVEQRGAGVNYTSGTQLPVRLDLTGDWDWSEDITVNRGGLSNLAKRDAKRASLSLSRTKIAVAGVNNDVLVAADLLDQKAENQGQRNDLSEGAVNAALRSRARIVEGVSLATRLYGVKRDGESTLGNFTNPTATTGDTLGAGVYYDRSVLEGSVVVSRASYDKRYLDFRRNSSGIIDTLFVPEGESKVVEELQERDFLSLNWDNAVLLGRVRLSALLIRDMDTEAYRHSQVGFRERFRDQADLKLSFPVGRDSLSVGYLFKWTWDDQTFQGATLPRGRQYSKTRELKLDWRRQLFRNTRLTGVFVTGLAQETAENQFNENDRDRLTGDASLKLDTAWPGKFGTGLLFQYRSTEDINLRATKSANNNFRQTFEIAPSYNWPVATWLNVSQVFRLYIQYQEYTFGNVTGVNKDDNYNKRGNLTTIVTVDPTKHLTVTAKFDYGSRFNATRAQTDAIGNDFYRRDQEQFTSQIDLDFKYEVSPWLSLSATTYRAKDRLESLGTPPRQTLNYSGEMTVGTTVSKTWSGSNPLTLAGRVTKHQAYGPNVTETNRDYWDADVSLKWSF
jgi:hypothetical protein